MNKKIFLKKQHIDLKKKKLIKENHATHRLRFIWKIRAKINKILSRLSGSAIVLILFILFVSALIAVKFYAERDPIVPVEGDNIPNLMLITLILLLPLQFKMMTVNDGEPWGLPL